MKTIINLLTALVLALLCINATAQVQAQKPQQAVVSKTLTLTAPGTLETRLSATEKKTLTAITLKGDIDSRDFIVMSEQMPALKSIDLSAAVIKAYEQFRENKLPMNAFFGKKNLTAIILPENLEVIGYNGFYGCSALKELTLPNSVKKIEGQAFIDCGIKSINIGTSLTKGLGELRECKKLESIYIDFSNKRYSLFYGLVYNYEKDTLIFCPPAKRTVFGELEFYPDLKVIDRFAFYGCKGLSGQLHLPYGLLEIGTSAFYGCTGLSGVVEIPGTVIRIGGSAFADCGISKIIIPELKRKDDPKIRGCFVDGSAGCELEIRNENTKNIKIPAKETSQTSSEDVSQPKTIVKKEKLKKVFQAVISEYKIKSVAAEKNGNLWVAYMDGVAKIENNKVTQYTWREGLPDWFIDGITIDRNNIVWIGYAGGIAKFSDGKWIAVKSPKRVEKILADSKGNIWARDVNSELYCYDGKKSRKIKFGKYIHFKRHIAINSKDVLFSADGFFNGLSVYDGEQLRTIDYPNEESIKNYIKYYIQFNDIYVDDKDQVWICTEGLGRRDNLGGLIKYDGKEWKNFLPKENVSSIRQDEKGNYWISTDKGIYKNFEFLSDEFKNGILIPCKNNTLWNVDLSGKVTLIELIE